MIRWKKKDPFYLSDEWKIRFGPDREFSWNWDRLPFTLKLTSSSISKTKLRSSSISKKIEVVFHLPQNWVRLQFTKMLRSSSNSCKLTWLTFTEKCWKINFLGWRGGCGAVIYEQLLSVLPFSLNVFASPFLWLLKYLLQSGGSTQPLYFCNLCMVDW